MSEEDKKVIEEEAEDVDEGVDADAAAMPPPPEKAIEIEKLEEQKLKSKYPAIGGRPGGGGHSAFLQKKMGKGQKYFDSGDYNMAKQGGRLGRGPIPVLAKPTGEEHPTPDSVPARKSSIIQGTNAGGAPAGHPVGQPLPNPAMARLL